eukprot:s2167_g4.t4
MTKLGASQRALVLYQHLQGAAWLNAEQLAVDKLSAPDGIRYFKEWITQHYLDVEVTQVGRSLSDLFRKLKRRPAQTFRDYVAEFNRLSARAAIILDRSMRKPWERRTNTVHMTDGTDDEAGDEGEDENLKDELGEHDNGDLYVSYMTAKARYKDAAKARGVDVEAVRKTAEQRVALAKSKSHCAACGQRGHWHKDAVCPKNRANTNGPGKDPKPHSIHVTNEVFELTTAPGGPLLAITDTACSRCVVGAAWLQRYMDDVKHSSGGRVYPYELINEKESFRFGASRVYESGYAAVILTKIGENWLAIKTAVIYVWAWCSMLSSSEIDPATVPKAWGDKEIEVLKIRGAYTAYVVGHGEAVVQGLNPGGDLEDDKQARVGHPILFYAKKISPAIYEALVADSLNMNTFLGWWNSTAISNDFWIETEHKLIRVHVTPRKSFFCGVSAPAVDIQPFGLAAAFSIELYDIPVTPHHGMSSRTAPWKMNKVELQQECTRLGIPFHPKWTVPELRHLLTENKETAPMFPKRLTSMSLAELRSEAEHVGIGYGPKETKGSIMLRIRDALSPDQTLMTVGRHTGVPYIDVPETYGDWASEEERRNGAHEPGPQALCELEKGEARAAQHELHRGILLRRSGSLGGGPAPANAYDHVRKELDGMVGGPRHGEEQGSILYSGYAEEGDPADHGGGDDCPDEPGRARGSG